MTNEQHAEYAFIIEESVRIIDSAIDGEYVIGPTGLTNALNDLRRTAAALRAPQGWQQIETAPKDWSWFLGYADGEQAIIRWRGSWQPDDWGASATHWQPLPGRPEDTK